MSLRESLIDTIFLTFIHNQDAIGYFLGILFAIFLLIYKPSRSGLLLLIGFSFLLFGFEYNKHIIEPLQDQTLSSLGLDESGGSASVAIIRVFKKILPIGFFIVGWGSLFLSIFLGYSSRKKISSEAA